MTVYNLPPLTRKHQLEPTSAGLWLAPPAGLDGLAADLSIDRDDQRPDELKSIPDAWAQVQLAVQAFFHAGHEASKPVERQWRGLLTLIALQPSYADDYALKIDWLELSHPSQDNAGRFQRMLRALLPSAYEPAGKEPARIGILRFNDRVPIAAVSPDMLLAPGRQAGVAQSSLPWMTDGLSDPLAVAEKMRPESWDILTKYLTALAESIDHGASDRVALKQKVQEFARECGQRQAMLGTMRRSVSGVAVPTFPMLGESWVAAVPPPEESACLLQLEARAGQPLEGVILVDPGLVATLKRPANAITVWKSYKLSDAQSPQIYDRISKEAAKAGFAVVRPEDFFTPTLVRLTGDVVIPGHPHGLQDALLPISPIALLFGAKPRIAASRAGESCDVSLEFNLKGGARHKVGKSFGATTTIDRRPPDDLALWPNFAAPQWPWNFMRYQYSKNGEDLRTRLALSVELLAHDIGAARSGSTKARQLLEWSSPDADPVDARLLAGDFGTVKSADGKPLFQRVRFTGVPEAQGEQQCVSDGIDAIFFALPTENGTAPAGCVLPRFAERGGRNEQTNVAIDFGTSNTIAYFARKGQPSELVTFEDRVLFPIAMDRKTEEIGASYADFFPLAAYETPMPTVLKKREYRGSQSRELGRLLAEVDEIEKTGHIPGMSHLVFFIPKIERGLNDTLLNFINKGMLRFEIKWETGADAKAIIRFYLRQLMIMIAAELVAEGGDAAGIRWRMSFPRAFSPDQVASFEDVTSKLAKAIYTATGGQGEGPDPVRRTEGEAAAAYFMDQKGHYPLVLMLDIGGGTTDIAIRHDRTVVWQGSVQLAARDFFRNYLANNPEALKNIDSEAALDPRQSRGDAGQRGARIRQFVDLWVAKPEFGTAFADAYSLHCDEPHWKGLRNSAAVALGGIMHYCRIVLDRLSAENKFPAADLDALTIFLGGRGSTFFRQIAAGGHPTTLMKLCSLATAASDPLNMDPHFSEFPKQEVARGLLLMDAGRGGPGAASQDMPLGLGVTVKGAGGSQAVGFEAPLTTLPPGGRVEDLDMAEFDNFLARLRDVTGLAIDTASTAGKTATKMRARAQLAVDLLGMSPDGRQKPDFGALEPPFISALRGLVDLLASAPDERRTLSVREE